MPSVTATLKRWDELKAGRSSYESVWQDIADYVTPFRADITRLMQPGAKRTDNLYDSTALHGHALLSATLHGTATPSTQPWISLTVRDEALNDDKTVQDWLEDCAERIHAALQQTNFNTSAHEYYLDLTGPSATACMFVDEKSPGANGAFGGLLFRAHPAAEYWIAEDAEGRVDTLYRSLKMTARAAVNEWGDKVGQKVQEIAKQKPDEKVEILHAVYPRRDLKYDGKTGKRKPGAKNMPWASCYIAVEQKHLIDEGGYHEFPFMVARWQKNASEPYGFGPSHIAYPDVRSLNAAKEFVLKAAPLAMQPPTIERDDSVLGDVDLTPGGRNVISGSGTLADNLAFLDTKNRPDLSQLILSELRQAVLEAYFVPQLHLKESPQMTATEVQARMEELLRFLGPVMARLYSEFLNPLVQRIFGIMSRAKAFLEPPQVLLEAYDADIDIEYEGPLARAQRSVEMVAQDRLINFSIALSQALAAAGLVELASQVWDPLDLDNMLRDRASITGVSSDSIRGAEAVQQIRQARAEALAKQQQAAQMLEAAKVAPGVMKEVREGASQMQGQAA